MDMKLPDKLAEKSNEASLPLWNALLGWLARFFSIARVGHSYAPVLPFYAVLILPSTSWLRVYKMKCDERTVSNVQAIAPPLVRLYVRGWLRQHHRSLTSVYTLFFSSVI